jgi:hypothetical protein
VQTVRKYGDFELVRAQGLFGYIKNKSKHVRRTFMFHRTGVFFVPNGH